MKLFNEGDIEFYAPEGDAIKKLPVFYNPEMQFDRELTVAILRAFGGARYCDALAGSGIRGLRAGVEAGFREIFLNDCSPGAVRLIQKNLEHNSAALRRNGIKAAVSCEDINLMLRQYRCDKFDVVDIDPFGSSIVALDSALRAIDRKHGMLCLTFTDTAPLCGVSIRTCLRRYDARPIRASYAKEVGLRILIGACARMVGKYDMALRPLFSYNRRHYFRLFLATENGISKADEMLGNISYLQHCFKCDWRAYADTNKFKERCPTCDGRLEWAGPLWKGQFADTAFLKSVLKNISADGRVGDLLRLVAEEQQVTLPFYDLHRLSELNKTISPRKKETIEKIRSGGGRATETHFSKTGIRSEPFPVLSRS